MTVAAGGRDIEPRRDIPAEAAIEAFVVGGFGEHFVRLDDRRLGINLLVFPGGPESHVRFLGKFGKQILSSGSSAFDPQRTRGLTGLGARELDHLGPLLGSSAISFPKSVGERASTISRAN